ALDVAAAPAAFEAAFDAAPDVSIDGSPDLSVDGSGARVTEPALDADAVVELAAALDAEAMDGEDGDDGDPLRPPDTLPEGALAIELGRRRAGTIQPPDPAAPGP